MLGTDEYRWYTGKARLRASLPDTRVSATVNLRMVRDSLIWATVHKLGIEVARVLITPDSIVVVDRVNREYSQDMLSSFLGQYGVQIAFADLQSALAGKMVALSPAGLETSHDKEFEILTVTDKYGMKALHWVSRTVPRRLLRSQLTDTFGRTLQIENMKWEPVGNGSEIPMDRLLAFEDDHGITRIEISFVEVAVDIPASLPFTIPGHYAKAR
jgi:hypothetical protein